jgi:hypothetical protein
MAPSTLTTATPTGPFYDKATLTWLGVTKKEEYDTEIRNLIANLDYISNNVDTINKVLLKLNHALCTLRLPPIVCNADYSAPKTDEQHPVTPLPEASSRALQVVPKMPPVLEAFSVVRGKEVLGRWKLNNTLSWNLNQLAISAINAMHDCGRKYNLAYHHIFHAFEVASDVMFYATELKLPNQWKPLLAMCGIMHDTFFERHRVQDEQRSATLLFKDLTPLLIGWSPKEEECLKKLINVSIIGGTLPYFYNTPENTNPGKPYMLILWETVLRNNPELQSKNELANIFTVLLAFTKADVHRSANSRLLTDYPKTLDYPIPETSKLDSVLRNLQGFSEDSLLSRKIVLGQNMRFGTENVLSTNNPNSNPIAFALYKQLAVALATGIIPDSILTDENLSEKIDALVTIFKKERDFSGLQKASQSESPAWVQDKAKTCSNSEKAWENNELAYNQLICEFQDKDKPLAEKNHLLRDLLLNGYHQQGRMLNPSALVATVRENLTAEDKALLAAEKVDSVAAPAAAPITPEATGEKEKAGPTAVKSDVPAASAGSPASPPELGAAAAVKSDGSAASRGSAGSPAGSRDEVKADKTLATIGIFGDKSYMRDTASSLQRHDPDYQCPRATR